MGRRNGEFCRGRAGRTARTGTRAGHAGTSHPHHGHSCHARRLFGGAVEGQRRFAVLLLALSLLLLIFFYGLSRCNPIQVFSQVTFGALAAAGLVSQVVAFLGPQILEPLSLAPAPGSSRGAQIGQDRFFPFLEAAFMHETTFLTMLVVARNANSFGEVVHAKSVICHMTTGGYAAISDIRVVIFHHGLILLNGIFHGGFVPQAVMRHLSKQRRSAFRFFPSFTPPPPSKSNGSKSPVVAVFVDQ